jgi:hypothetical protein
MPVYQATGGAASNAAADEIEREAKTRTEAAQRAHAQAVAKLEADAAKERGVILKIASKTQLQIFGEQVDKMREKWRSFTGEFGKKWKEAQAAQAKARDLEIKPIAEEERAAAIEGLSRRRADEQASRYDPRGNTPLISSLLTRSPSSGSEQTFRQQLDVQRRTYAEHGRLLQDIRRAVEKTTAPEAVGV